MPKKESNLDLDVLNAMLEEFQLSPSPDSFIPAITQLAKILHASLALLIKCKKEGSEILAQYHQGHDNFEKYSPETRRKLLPEKLYSQTAVESVQKSQEAKEIYTLIDPTQEPYNTDNTLKSSQSQSLLLIPIRATKITRVVYFASERRNAFQAIPAQILKKIALAASKELIAINNAISVKRDKIKTGKIEHELRNHVQGVGGVVDLVLANEIRILQEQLSEKTISLLTENQSALEALQIANKQKEKFLEEELKAMDSDLKLTPYFISKRSRSASHIHIPEMMSIFPAKIIIENVIQEMQVKADGKGMRFKIIIPEDLPLIESQRVTIHDMLKNYVGNALKYGLDEIEIHCQCLAINPDENEITLEYSVINKIKSPELRQKDFSLFSEGTGFGLQIVDETIISFKNGTASRKIIERNGEKVFCANFSMTLPIAKSIITQALPSLESKMRILSIEDNTINQKLLHKRLSQFDLIQALDGKTALESLKTTDKPFSFILCDLHLPDMQGEALIQSIRKLNQNSYLMTLSGSKLKKADCQRLGVDFCLQKPYQFDKILEILMSHQFKPRSPDTRHIVEESFSTLTI